MKRRSTTNAEKQARYREAHLGADKERAQFVFDTGTKARLAAIAAHYGHSSVTALLEQWSKNELSKISKKI